MSKIDIELQHGHDIEKLKTMEPINRTKLILEIKALEKLEPSEDGIELNEGYEYDVDGSLPQLADAIAKLALEIDNSGTFGPNAGKGFVDLIANYYDKIQK